jgi:hypothetical protein
MGQEQVRFNLAQLFLSLLVVCVAITYLGPALLNRDLLWFMPFNATPDKIIFYRDGRQLVVTADDPHFNDMVKVLNRALSSIETIDLIGPSPGTIEDYRAQDIAVELLYARPVQLKSSQNVGMASAIFIPLTGRHTERPRIFTGSRVSADADVRSSSTMTVPATYGAGTPVLRDLSAVRQLIDSLQF